MSKLVRHPLVIWDSGDIFIVDVAMMWIMAEDGGRVCRIHRRDMPRVVQGILALSIKNMFLIWHST